MNVSIKQQILDRIEAYDRIVICRHTRPDGDAYGSTMGLRKILKDTYPSKQIFLVNDDYSDYLSFLGEEDTLSPEEYHGALGIVLDTGTQDRISNQNLSLVEELIKIDHHVDIKPYGDISWVEDNRSSACEMVADFWYTFRDKLVMSREAATYIYCGMITDSGRFQYEGVTGETLRLAGALLDYRIDTSSLFAHLYMNDFGIYKFKAYVYEHLNITKNGVAYIYVDKTMQEKFGLNYEQASAVIGELGSIRGSLIWLAFIDNVNETDGSIRVRLRSRFVKINKLAEKYHGGGHEMASGATVYSPEEMQECLDDADKLLAEYKSTHEDWL